MKQENKNKEMIKKAFLKTVDDAIETVKNVFEVIIFILKELGPLIVASVCILLFGSLPFFIIDWLELELHGGIMMCFSLGNILISIFVLHFIDAFLTNYKNFKKSQESEE